MGTADPSNISSKLREGYEPCKAEEYPELMMHATTEGRFKGGIEVGGLLFCRIPEEFLKQRPTITTTKTKLRWTQWITISFVKAILGCLFSQRRKLRSLSVLVLKF
jgi:hypothetical protein